MKASKRVTKTDVIVVVIILITAFAGVFFMNTLSNRGYVVKISQNGEIVKEAFLDDAGRKEFEFKGENGKKNVVVISDGYVFMESANCPDGTCVKKGKISEIGETVVCLPNDIVIEVSEDNSIEESPF